MMTTAVLYGVSAGALHAVTGPNHVLSLGPIAVRASRAWQVGLRWGFGHGVGTLLLAIPLLVSAQALDLGALAVYGERIAGIALLVMAVSSARQLLLKAAAPTSTSTDRSRTFTVGFVHGVSGGASLLLALPILLVSSVSASAAYLVAFAVGSTIAMAALTASLAKWGAALSSTTHQRLQWSLVAMSVGLGLAWLFSA